MRKLSVLVLAVLSACCACFAQKHLVPPSEPVGQPFYGIGLEMDPVWVMDDVRNHSVDEAAWENIYAPRLRAMQVKRFRMMIIPSWYEKVNDNDDPYVYNWDGFDFSENGNLRQLYRQLDFVQSVGGEALLVPWGCPTNHFLRDPQAGSHWVSRTGDDEEFAENVTALLKHLIQVKGYTCIKEVTLYNEPECSVSPMEFYQKTCRVFERRLRLEGLRDKIRFNCSDNTDTRRWFLEAAVQRSSDIADMYNSHTYLYDDKTTNSTMYMWEKRNVESCKGKPHYVCEYGVSNAKGNNATDCPERGVTLTRIALNFINAGASGCSLWIAYDQHYGGLHTSGLWRSIASLYPGEKGVEDFQVRPMYHSYSLMTRFIPAGSEIYPLDLDDEFAAGTLVRTGEGVKTWIFANGNAHPLKFSIPAKDKLYEYVYAKGLIPTDDRQVSCSATLKASLCRINVEIPAWSVVYLSEADDRAKELSIVENRPMEDVRTLVLSSNLDIVYAPCCWPQQVDVFAPAHRQKDVVMECKDGVMRVEGDCDEAKVYISGPTATGYVNTSDSGDIILDGDVSTSEDVRVEIKGKGSIRFNGLSCKSLEVILEGDGNVTVEALKADKIQLKKKGKGCFTVKKRL